MTRQEKRDAWALVAFMAMALVTAPMWILAAPVYCIWTGRTLRGCGEEANRMSGYDAD